MFSKLALFAAASMAVFVAAIPTGGIENSCNVGSTQCCNSVQSSNTDIVQGLFSLLGIQAGSVTGQVGVTCSPLGLGVSGTSCSAQPVCCSNNSFNGIVALGCTPINLNL